MRSSLFVEPTLFVIAAIVLAAVSLRIDDVLGDAAEDLPLGIPSTVESSRAVLSTVAGATITVAGIAFSIALLVFQMASSQYSPRVVQGLFRDPVNKRIMGFVVGTFTYCLVVLRSVRSPLTDDGDPVIPNVSVAIAVLLGIGSILSIIAFINHNAHTMEVSEILNTVTRQTLGRLHDGWPKRHRGAIHDRGPKPVTPPGQPMVITATRSGWVQYVDHDALLDALPDHTVAVLDVSPGSFATQHAPLCSVWGLLHPGDRIRADIRGSVHVGRTRTIAQDPAYGIRQIVDVGLRALSPGVNDPTTAHEAMLHLGAILADAYRRTPPPVTRRGDRGQVLHEPHAPGHRELTALAFDELRSAVADHPRSAIDLLHVLTVLCRADHGCRDCVADLREHGQLVIEQCEDSSMHPRDRSEVRRAHDELLEACSTSPSVAARREE